VLGSGLRAVLAVGYDGSKERFIARNSWGEKWGVRGYFTMPFEYLTDPELATISGRFARSDDLEAHAKANLHFFGHRRRNDERAQSKGREKQAHLSFRCRFEARKDGRVTS